MFWVLNLRQCNTAKRAGFRSHGCSGMSRVLGLRQRVRSTAGGWSRTLTRCSQAGEFHLCTSRSAQRIVIYRNYCTEVRVSLSHSHPFFFSSRFPSPSPLFSRCSSAFPHSLSTPLLSYLQRWPLLRSITVSQHRLPCRVSLRLQRKSIKGFHPAAISFTSIGSNGTD
jgi:hypothetical protein